MSLSARFRRLEDKMSRSHQVMETEGERNSAPYWLEVWQDVRQFIIQAEKKSLDEFEGEQSDALDIWLQDLEMCLWNAGIEDPQYLHRRIEIQRELATLLPNEGEPNRGNWRSGIAEAYFQLEDTTTAFKLLDDWLAEDPTWGSGWLCKANYYLLRRVPQYPQGENILLDALRVEGIRDRSDIVNRLGHICEQTERPQEAAKYFEESGRKAREPVAQLPLGFEHTLRTLVSQKVSSKTKAMPSLNSGREQVSASMTRSRPANLKPKSPCPCGSTRQFKKCCGRGLF